MRLGKSFFEKTAIEVAPLLIGKLLCRNVNDKIEKHIITETEIYFGEKDTACHAHKGKTERTKIMYESGGVAYVYLCYGLHNMLNIVTGKKGHPEAVLIRAIEKLNGPGKLTKALKIDRFLNGENLVTSNEIWIEDIGINLNYKTDKRVGIDYATEEYKNKLWRFIATK